MPGGPASRGWRLPLVLALVCVALGGALAAVLRGADPTVTEIAATPMTDTASEATDQGTGGAPGSFRMQPVHAFANVTDRPLFYESRRPVNGAASGDEGVVSTEKPELLLRGTIVMGDTVRIALVETDGTSRIVRQGGDVDGWVVTAIERDRMVLGQGDTEAVYSLDETFRKAILEAPRDRIDRRAAMRERLAEEEIDLQQYSEE